MRRFFGMMPSNEVKRQETFKDGLTQLTVTVQAGGKGWTVLWGDGSTDFKDNIDTVDNNFNKAMECLTKSISNIIKVTNQ